MSQDFDFYMQFSGWWVSPDPEHPAKVISYSVIHPDLSCVVMASDYKGQMAAFFCVSEQADSREAAMKCCWLKFDIAAN